MEKYKCKICGKEVSANNSNLGSHTKRVHGISYKDYFKEYEYEGFVFETDYRKSLFKNFKNLTPDFQNELCSFCEKMAKPNYHINYENKTYEISYDGVYSCRTKECLNKRSLDYLGVPYNSSIRFDRISCILEYGAKLKRISMKEQIHRRSKGVREMTWKVNLESYIEKYGEIEGTKLYKERCEKISYSQSVEWYIEKYGDIEGPLLYNAKKEKQRYHSSLEYYQIKLGEQEGLEHFNNIQRKKTSRKSSGPSKASLILKKYLDKNDIEYIQEFPIKRKNGGYYYVDYYLPKLNIIVEYYGDYWHGNPTIYKSFEIFKNTGITFNDVWERDKNRINEVKDFFDNEVSICIIWGSYKLTEQNFLENINNIINLNTNLELI